MVASNGRLSEWTGEGAASYDMFAGVCQRGAQVIFEFLHAVNNAKKIAGYPAILAYEFG
jgi:hypothetical protein